MMRIVEPKLAGRLDFSRMQEEPSILTTNALRQRHTVRPCSSSTCWRTTAARLRKRVP